MGDPRSERLGQDDAAPGGRRTAVAHDRHGGDPRCPSGSVDVRTLRPRVALVSGAVTRQLRADLPARDVVASGRHGALETWWNRYTEEDWEKADALLARGGVGDLGDRPFGVISEGERQQVLLARALMSDPELLLLDEPFAGLDLGARERLLVRLTASGRRSGQPADRAGHAPLRGDPPGFTHGGTGRERRLVASGRLPEVVTSALVSDCFGLAVTVGMHRRAVVEPRRRDGDRGR